MLECRGARAGTNRCSTGGRHHQHSGLFRSALFREATLAWCHADFILLHTPRPAHLPSINQTHRQCCTQCSGCRCRSLKRVTRRTHRSGCRRRSLKRVTRRTHRSGCRRRSLKCVTRCRSGGRTRRRCHHHRRRERCNSRRRDDSAGLDVHLTERFGLPFAICHAAARAEPRAVKRRGARGAAARASGH